MAYVLNDKTGNWEHRATGNANGNNPYSGSKQSGTAQKNDKGNTKDTNSGIKESTNNKTMTRKYAEEGRFTCTGRTNIRRNGTLNITDGLAKRWLGVWEIRETTHTISSAGYVVEGLCVRKPYIEVDKDDTSKNKKVGNAGSGTKSDKTATKNKSTKNVTGGSNGSNKTWKVNPNTGKWNENGGKK